MMRARLQLWVLLVLAVSACGGPESARPGIDASLPPGPGVDAAAPDAAAPDAAPFCGDGIRQQNEACDHRDFGGRTCVDEGYYAGDLACRPECKVEASGCSGRCGDGEINGPERCDVAQPRVPTCRSRGFLTGTPRCDAGCLFLGCRNVSFPDEELVLAGRDETSSLGVSLAFAGDVDGDGRADLLAAAPGEVRVLGKKGAAYLIAGTSEGRATINDAARFVDDRWRAASTLVLEVAPARDLDGDSRPDFLIAAWTDASALDVYLVYGRPAPFTGTLKLADLVETGAAARFSIPLAAAPQGRRVALGVPDVTGDGRDDLLLAVPGHGGGLGATYVIPGDRVRYSGTVVLPAPVAPLPLPVHAVIVGAAIEDALGKDVAAGDFDGDGVADLFVTRGGDVQIFYGPIAGVLSPGDAASHTDVGDVTSLAVADFDGDEDADLIVTTGQGGHLFRGGPARREGALMTSAADVQLATGSAKVRPGGDLDGDGHRELVVLDRGTFQSAVGIIAGPIAQTEAREVRWQLQVFHSAGDPLDVALADFNGDGFDDVAVAQVGDRFGRDQGVVQIVTGATPAAP